MSFLKNTKISIFCAVGEGYGWGHLKRAVALMRMLHLKGLNLVVYVSNPTLETRQMLHSSTGNLRARVISNEKNVIKQIRLLPKKSILIYDCTKNFVPSSFSGKVVYFSPILEGNRRVVKEAILVFRVNVQKRGKFKKALSSRWLNFMHEHAVHSSVENNFQKGRTIVVFLSGQDDRESDYLRVYWILRNLGATPDEIFFPLGAGLENCKTYRADEFSGLLSQASLFISGGGISGIQAYLLGVPVVEWPTEARSAYSFNRDFNGRFFFTARRFDDFFNCLPDFLSLSSVDAANLARTRKRNYFSSKLKSRIELNKL